MIRPFQLPEIQTRSTLTSISLGEAVNLQKDKRGIRYLPPFMDWLTNLLCKAAKTKSFKTYLTNKMT